MKEIALGNGGVTIVDDEDFEWASQWPWFARRHGSKVYAQRSERRGGRKAPKRIFLLHRELMRVSDPEVEVDHKNGDGLDNRRSENLRIAGGCGNNRNARKTLTRGRSRFKGATWAKHTERWQARIGVNGKKLFLGYFDSDEDAARAYDDAAREHHGEFACVNFPRPGEQGALRGAG